MTVRRRAAELLLRAFFAAYYVWTVLPHFKADPTELSMHAVLASSFLYGQTDLLMEPKPELMALPDPYDPVQNLPHRMHDLSLYKGRYYMYFGPAPAALVFLPVELLFRTRLTDPIAAALFAVGAFLAACWVLRMLIARWYSSTPAFVYYGLAFTMGFCNVYPFVLRRPAVYEVSILSSQFFLLLGLAFVIKAAFDRASTRWSIAAGVILGAAVLSRASLVVAVAGFVSLVYFLDRDGEPLHRRHKLIAVAGPVLAAAALCAVYNWIRFDSPIEFGTHYQLSGIHPMKTNLFSAARVPLDAYLYLAYPPKVNSMFPFLFANKLNWQPGSKYLLFEMVTGLLWLSPLLLFLPALIPPLRRRETQRRHEQFCVLSVILIAAVLFFLLDATILATMRYEGDFATLFFLAAAIAVIEIGERLSSKRNRIAFGSAVALLSAFGIVLNCAIGLMGYYSGLDISAPEHFQVLQRLFHPVSVLLTALGVAP